MLFVVFIAGYLNLFTFLHSTYVSTDSISFPLRYDFYINTVYKALPTPPGKAGRFEQTIPLFFEFERKVGNKVETFCSIQDIQILSEENLFLEPSLLSKWLLPIAKYKYRLSNDSSWLYNLDYLTTRFCIDRLCSHILRKKLKRDEIRASLFDKTSYYK